MLHNNLLALVATFLLSLVWLRIMDFAAHRGWIGSQLSRKLIHIGTGPLFVLCWFFFDDAPSARWLAALVPLAFSVQFFLIGMGMVRDEASVKAMSRSGNPREILRGPLLYGIIHVALTLIYWRENPIGIVALMLLCGGDGLADVLGRRLGKYRLPWNPGKTWAGSLGMLLGGFAFSAGILAIYVAAGVFPGPFSNYLLALALISLAGAAVESIPLHDLDNLTVTLAALALGHVLFGG